MKTISEKSSIKFATASNMGKLNELDVKIAPHVSNLLPNEYIVIECKNTDYSEALRQLKRHDVIGVSLEGTDIGRNGTLHYLNVSSSTCTYLFNISELKKDVFEEGLKAIFENQRIVKVLHDCRKVSDCIYHQYKTKLSNVYDTQVADFVVSAIKKSPKLITNKVNSLNHCLEHYLSIPKEFLREKSGIADGYSSSLLKPGLINLFIKNVIYLRTLKQELDIILRMPFRRCVDIFLQTVLRKEDHELKLHPPELGLIPGELVSEKLQTFTFSEDLKPKNSSKFDDIDDPVARYQRDCLKNQCGKFKDKEYQNDLHEEEIENTWRYSNRFEIIQFLLDKMYAGDSDNRSVITMSPFGGSDDYDQCSVSASMYDGILPEENMISNKGSAYHISGNLNDETCVLKTKTSHSPVLNNQFKTDNVIPEKSIEPSSASNKLKDCNGDKPANINNNSTSNNSYSSNSSLSGKSLVYKKLAEQKKSFASQKHLSNNTSVSSDSKYIPTLPSVALVSQPKINDSSSSHSSRVPSICKRIQEVLDKYKQTKVQNISQSSSVSSTHRLDLVSKVKHENQNCSTVAEPKLSSEQKYFKDIKSTKKAPLGNLDFKENQINDVDISDSSYLQKESPVDINSDQNEDSWTKLRRIFCENEPPSIVRQKLVFIPAGMQC